MQLRYQVLAIGHRAVELGAVFDPLVVAAPARFVAGQAGVAQQLLRAVAASSGIGGGLASVISPAKLQNASASIDRIGEEAGVLRVTFVVSLVITAICALLAMLWAF